METDNPTRRKRAAFGRKTYRRPPTNPPPYRTNFPPQQPGYPQQQRPNFPVKNPYPYNFNRPLPSEHRGQQQQPQQPQYRTPPQYSQQPQYPQPEYYDAGTADTDGEGEAYYTENHYAPEYDNNGGPIGGEDKDVEENDTAEEETQGGGEEGKSKQRLFR